MKFTFKTDKPTGQYNSFSSPTHNIKFKKIVVGMIDDKEPFKIRLQVIKKDILEDGNANCKWKWIVLQKNSTSLEEAKTFLNENIIKILEKYPLYLDNN